jgi:hypothetical protein
MAESNEWTASTLGMYHHDHVPGSQDIRPNHHHNFSVFIPLVLRILPSDHRTVLGRGSSEDPSKVDVSAPYWYPFIAPSLDAGMTWLVGHDDVGEREPTGQAGFS